MKVTISYQCEFEDVPKHIRDLLRNLQESDMPAVKREIAGIEHRLGDGNINEALMWLDTARLKLANIDQKLLDYGGVLAGFVKTDADLKMGIDLDAQNVDIPEGTMPEESFDIKEIINDKISASNSSESE
jgi:hypothetical protein